jgi:translation initiation factor IF-2
MDVPVTEVIAKCVQLGLMVSINQRLEKDTIELVADEFGFEVSFEEEYTSDEMEDFDDTEETLKPRPPVVTIMGHVDHGKTSLLDYVREANVVAGESGGITQHIGAYQVKLDEGKLISFLDTPGHEAFTAMRARGAQITDIVVLIVAADDAVMPQTVEAINHAQAAGVPIIVAINKIDKPTANIDKIKQQLADRNVLVEDWGGKYQTVEISAKTGKNVDQLLEKIHLESEMLELKANPDRNARAVVVEAELDKGRGVTATVLVRKGTLKIGDPFVAGNHFGRVRAMFDERNNKLEEAKPAQPALILGLDGAPQAGDELVVLDSERQAHDIAQKRQQLKREQDHKQVRHVTLDEISRRIAEGGVKELPIVVKGDVDGSVEALADSMMKLSNREVAVRVIHRAVGAITESDVLLANASGAIIVGFHVRPNLNARKLAESQNVDIRLYHVIYDAINEVKSALEGMLSPVVTEETTGTLEVRDTFKVPKVGTIAGCYVQDGKITRNDKLRVFREGVAIYDGAVDSLKRFKDDAKEVVAGFECGVGVENYNDIKVGDVLEPYRLVETKKTLEEARKE